MVVPGYLPLPGTTHRKKTAAKNGGVMNWRKSSYSAANGDCVEVGSWRKSSYSAYNGNCVEVGSWRKSTHSAGGDCIEVGTGQSVIAVRDTKANGAGPVLTFTPQAWVAFISSLRA